MTITPEARHYWEQAIFAAWFLASAGFLSAFILRLRRKGNRISRSASYGSRLGVKGRLLVVSLLMWGGDTLLDRVPTRYPVPRVAMPQEAAAADAAAAKRLRLAKGRTLRRGDAVRIVWDRGAAGAAAAGGSAAHQIFGAGAAPDAVAAVRRADAGSVYDVTGGTAALFMYYDTGFPDSNVACVILEEGPHALKRAWVPGERLRKQAAPPASPEAGA